MSKWEFFQTADMIQNTRLQMTLIRFVNDMVSPDFFKVPASSTGLRHPDYALGVGGLVHHTLATIKVAEEFMRMKEYGKFNKDHVLAALLLHDAFKYWDSFGTYNYDHFKTHPEVCAAAFKEYSKIYHYHPPRPVLQAIRRHMGQWGTYKPRTKFEKFIALCDYVASRKYTTFKFTED